MDKFDIGVIGKGFVGSAVAHGFSSGCGYEANVLIYDKNQDLSQNSLEEVVTNSQFIFISVPTPSNRDGSINLDIINGVISEIDEVDTDNKPIILIRSTVVPGTCDQIQTDHPNLKIVLIQNF